MRGLDGLQLTKQTVVFGIRDFRRIQHVVTVAMVLQFAPQHRGTFTQRVFVGYGNAHEKSLRASTEPAARSCSASVAYNCAKSLPIMARPSIGMTRPLSSVISPSMLAASAMATSHIRSKARSSART